MTKVFYNSKLAKFLTFIEGFSTMMFFGFILTEKESLSDRVMLHEETHVRQYWDCFALGIGIAIILLFTLFAFGVAASWYLLFLAIIPLVLYYLLYFSEYLYWVIRGKGWKDAYDYISFEIHAYWIDSSWNLPCEKQNHYVSFGWWMKSFQ